MSPTPTVPPPTRCYLIRHCDVANPDGILYGHLPGFGLSAKGRDQARAIGRHLAGAELQAIYSSPLERALETASLLARELAPPPSIEPEPGLIEAEFGRYLQGTRYRDVVWRKPRWWVHMVWPGLVPGDESMAAMSGRVTRVIERGLERHAGQAFALVSHGDPIQAFWATSEGRMPWALHRLLCAKGGLLELTYLGKRLAGKVYLPPKDLERLGTEAGPTGPEPALPRPG
ncbi:MAG: histidine phosphatase family protein [Candidatus Dormibacteria bacterium]